MTRNPLSCILSPDLLQSVARDATAQEMKASMLTAIEGWHPAARALVDNIEPDSMFMIRMSRTGCAWPTRR